MNDAERFEQIFLSQVTRPGADMIATQREKHEEVL